MKYTNYIINGNIIDINSMVTKNNYVNIITIPLGSIISILGIVFLTCVLPVTITIDSVRYSKLQYYYYCKRMKRRKLIDDILISLSIKPEERVIMRRVITNVNYEYAS